MSIQHRDLANAAKQLNMPAGLETGNMALISQLANLIEGFAPADLTDSQSATNEREEQIRNMRVEFGFAPDDAPVAHLHPLATGLAS
jgi:hypothetical protein